MKRIGKILLGVIAGVLILAIGGLFWKTRQEAYDLLHSPIETRDALHTQEIIDALNRAGYPPRTN